jgi:hypothetical protein
MINQIYPSDLTDRESKYIKLVSGLKGFVALARRWVAERTIEEAFRLTTAAPNLLLGPGLRSGPQYAVKWISRVLS